MADQNNKPLSLNDRADLFLQNLPRSRPPSEKPHKVKLDGRRRLCKVATEPVETDPSGFESLPEEEVKIREILGELTARFECLSVERTKKGKEEESEEFGSASSSLESEGKDEGKVKVVEEENVREMVDDGKMRISSLFSPSPCGHDSENKRKVKVVEEEEEFDLNDEVDGVSEVTDHRKNKGKVVDLEEEFCLEDEEEIESKEVLGVDEERDFVVDVSDDELEVGGLKDEKSEEIVMEGSGGRKQLRYVLPGKIARILFPHQRDGLRWLWSLHCGGTGGILGDDMGLGKTMQMSAYLAGLFSSRLIKRAMVVAPKTLLSHWVKELTVVGLSAKIKDYSGTSVKARNYELDTVFEEGGVLLTTYDIVRINFKSLRGDYYSKGRDDDEILWDYVILDEGHIIKNPSTQRTKSLHDIPSSHRIIISGTPIQNNLKELWALFNFSCPHLLGDKKEFKEKYEYKILRGNDKVANDREKYIGSTVAKELRERMKPYFLRRLKSEVFGQSNSTEGAKLSRKTELIVWIKLSQYQRKLYEAFLNSDLVKSSVIGSPLAAITILKKICDHPSLLTKRAAEEVIDGMDAMLNKDDFGMVENMVTSLVNMTRSGEMLVDNAISCKMCFVLPLLDKLVSEGHTVLIFSQTRKMLNFIQEAIESEGYKYLRIDGTTKISDRERIVNDFQEGAAPIFLLTSRVGGLGLTLTRADRVIVADPAWNPSTDNQSVDRAYRIGQEKDVIVYRLMTCGTIEEKIYKMQVFKGALFRIATEKKDQTRYFSQKDLQELFSLPKEGFDVSLTRQQLEEEHGHGQQLDENLSEHIAFLELQNIAGVSHHSMLFSRTVDINYVDLDKEDSVKNKKIVRSGQVNSYSEPDSDLAQYAFKPKAEKPIYRPNSQRQSPKNPRAEIEEKINRLYQTLSNTDVVMKLSDKGAKIRQHIAQLKLELSEMQSYHAQTTSAKNSEVIDLDDLADVLQQGLTM